MMYKHTLLLFLVLTLNISNSNAQGGLLFEVPLKQQIETAELVISGKVINETCVWNTQEDNIYTLHTISVYSVFKGTPTETITIATIGGKKDGIEQIVIPNLVLNKGDFGVFVLQKAPHLENEITEIPPTELYSVYSNLQGFYKYDAIVDGFDNAFNHYNGLENFYNAVSTLTKRPLLSLKSKKQTAEQQIALSSKTNMAPEQITISPTVLTAGTASRLTLSGIDFGNAPGSVGFRNADTGGVNSDGSASYVNALSSQIISWSATQIVVEVPENAGTGDVRVTKADGTFGVSNQILTVTQAITNDNQGRRTQHVSRNDTGNITWTYSTVFNSNIAAIGAFTRALDAWRCQTRMHWETDNITTSITRSASDGVNVITFDNTANPLPEGVLGNTSLFLSDCGGERSAILEIDIVFNDNINNPNTPANESWYFGNDANGIAFAQWDFQSIALHELGHALQLSHVIDTDDVMHYAISNFEIQRELSNANIEAAQDIQNIGTSNILCSFTRMTNYSGACVLNTEASKINASDITLYPNPATNSFNINNNTAQNIKAVTIFDIRGRVAFTSKIQTTEITTSIPLKNTSKGIYLVKIELPNTIINRKLIIQ